MGFRSTIFVVQIRFFCISLISGVSTLAAHKSIPLFNMLSVYDRYMTVSLFRVFSVCVPIPSVVVAFTECSSVASTHRVRVLSRFVVVVNHPKPSKSPEGKQ